MIIKRIYNLVVAITALFVSSQVMGQTNISGIINDYTAVTSIDYIDNSVDVSSSASFNIGDRVLIIQMLGATIDQSQSSSFGTITNYNNAGNYEFQTICDIQGQEISFTYDLINSYDPAGTIQLVSVPVYANANMAGGILTAKAWDGTSGGILALEVTGTLDFTNQNINVSGLGFRGGTALVSGQSCSWILDGSYYSSVSSSDQKAIKGEGIASSIVSKECGRGPQANGGGGGNNHNGGGGGGANYGAGGSGGERKKRSTFVCGAYTTVASKDLSSGYGNNRIFMGGGGGAGHVNNTINVGEHGKNGGGIVIIKANTIIGNGQQIIANGLAHSTTAGNDGGGGGGGGGSVILDVNTVSSPLTVSVDGGKGADTYNTGTSNCNGPGGGGGGGIVLLSSTSVSPNLTISTNGGGAGTIFYNQQTNCTNGSTNNATSGAGGTTTTGYILQEGLISIGCSGILPIELLEFKANTIAQNRVLLSWKTASEINNELFEIERSDNGIEWSKIGAVKGAGNSTQIINYRYVDDEPFDGTSYYRLKQIDFNGTYSHSEIRIVSITKNIIASLYPNPSSGTFNIDFFTKTSEAAVLHLYDSSGRLILNKNLTLTKGSTKQNYNISNFDNGLYFIRVYIPGTEEVYHATYSLIK